MGENLEEFKKSTEKVFDHLRLHKLKAANFTSKEYLRTFRVLVIWYGLKPEIGHLFKCCDSILKHDEEAAMDLFRSTS